MMVTFISQCEKRALKHTRRILDAFANRIGNNTWQTIITEDGLVVVKKLLRMKATKNTAVSCHWLCSRNKSKLLWIVGTRSKFNHQGIVPVNSTKKSLSQNKWENDWHNLPLIKALVAVAALLHDWGKASVLFQKKLSKGSKKSDPLRHEWVSYLLLNALVQYSGNIKTDESWLNLLIQQNWNEESLKQIVAKNLDKTKALDQLPPIAQLVAWLIVSHHRLPGLEAEEVRSKYRGEKKDSIQDLLEIINATWGYQNKFDENDYEKRLKQCFEFDQGLLSQSSIWNKQIKKWALRLYQEQQSALTSLENGSWRVVLHHARLCLMLGDHYYSSCDKANDWKTSLKLIANTDKNGKSKQYLDEHLVYVSQHALQVVQSLSRLSEEMDLAYDIHNLKKKSPQGFKWQDQAVENIKQFLQQQQHSNELGWFVVNMASTGKGKTIANAKIMQALSKDGESLRYILALGLRTLTLQTGNSYRNDIGLGKDELAVVIGSKAVQELYQKQSKPIVEQQLNFEDLGSESLEDLLDNELDYDLMPQADFMNVLFSKSSGEKNKAFLYKPVLVCTIDHIMAATETIRGGKYILPCLRLLSSDLVIDEVDDFTGQDLVAIARLVHLAGMLGRKVMISSATIPPALAEGFFNAYCLGWQLYCRFKQLKNNDVVGMWVDEFKTQINLISSQKPEATISSYKIAHQKFVQARVQQLLQQVVKHKAYIVKCEQLKTGKQSELDESIQAQYFELVKTHIQHLHQQHHTVDILTNKKVSFGVVRIANIMPCVTLAKYLLNANWPSDTAPRVMAYHSQQVLLLRSEQEAHLDTVLKRKEKPGEQPVAFNDPIIRSHLDSIDAKNVIFVLVATPVEEVGRDHDFDWAIVEPSSYRSIIQLIGRILRHRELMQDIKMPNIALMQYNLRGLRQAKIAFENPGFEINNDYFRLETKDLEQLLDVNNLKNGINAVPRIQESQPLQATKKLADLEHAVMARYLTKYELKGANEINGWLNETWFLTALPQLFNPFRHSLPNIQLYAIMQNHKLVFCEKNDFGEYIDRSMWYRIKQIELTELEQQRLWLDRNYYNILYRDVLENMEENEDIEEQITIRSKRYGEIMLPKYDSEKVLMYSAQFGLVAFNDKGR